MKPRGSGAGSSHASDPAIALEAPERIRSTHVQGVRAVAVSSALDGPSPLRAGRRSTPSHVSNRITRTRCIP